MTQHLGHQHLSAQTFSAYDPAAPIYCSSVTPAPEHYAYQYHHHHYQPLQHQHQQLQQELQFNYHRLSAHIHPQHQEEALRLHQLQQDAMLQQQQAMYHQQILAYQQQQSHYQANQSRSPTKRMQTKADRRAEHNAIERLRRENLNSKFQQLAHSLPNLQNERRPSKGTIIERTLDFVKTTIQKEEKFISEIRRLREEYEDLMQQLYPGQALSPCGSVFSDEDMIVSNKRSTSPPCESSTQKSSSCPSLELSSEENATAPPSSAQQGSASFFDAYGMDMNPLNDVMFGHLPEQQQPAVSYESDNDSSSTNPDDLDLTSATITANIATMTDKVSAIPSDDYRLNIKSHCLDP